MAVSGIAAGFTIDTPRRLCYKQGNKLGIFMVLQCLMPSFRRMGPFATQPWARGLPEDTVPVGMCRFRSHCQALAPIVPTSMMYYPHGAAL